jgi:hypothetical protein
MTTFYCLRFEILPTWTARSRIYIPHEHGGPVIPSGTGIPFHRLLRLAGLRWRYSTPSSHIIYDTDRTENTTVSTVVVQVSQLLSKGLHNTVSNSNSIALEALFVSRTSPSNGYIRHNINHQFPRYETSGLQVIHVNIHPQTQILVLSWGSCL